MIKKNSSLKKSSKRKNTLISSPKNQIKSAIKSAMKNPSNFEKLFDKYYQ